MKKRILSLALAAALCLSLSAPALAAGLDNFQKTSTYTPGQFADVPAGSWYAAGVQSAYELGLMTGTGPNAFNPSGNLSVAETVVLAARLHSTYVGDNAAFTGSGDWYQPYVDYAVENGIIAAGAYSDYTAAATRAQFAAILAAALPDEALPAINSVASLPDVDANAPYAAAALKLYNAGILTGSDTAGTFNPESSIQRSEVATIVTRMADQSQRKTFTLSAAHEPGYDAITDGKWSSDEPYAVLHRCAVADGFQGLGVADRMVEECKALTLAMGRRWLRADTHKKNKTMQNLLRRSGFQYRGNVLVDTDPGHDPRRLAFEVRLAGKPLTGEERP